MQHRRADIQGLRAISVILVVAFHAGLDVPGGYVGVDVFFAVSGFVITAMLWREIGRGGRISFSDFYSRRVRRILPALGLTVGVVAIASLGAISPSQQSTTARTGVATVFSVANIFLYRAPHGYFDASQNLNPLLHMWSLSVEEQFYVFFPALLAVLVLAAARLRRRGEPVALAGIGVVTLASFAFCVLATDGFSLFGFRFDQRFAFYMAPTRAWEFGIGAFLAVVAARTRAATSTRDRAAGPVVATAVAAVGLGLIAYAGFAFDGTTKFPGAAAAVPVLGAALVIAAGTFGRSPLNGALGWRPLTAVGDLSYSWYLWHWPLIVFARALFPNVGSAALVAAVVSILPAWASYRWVETPVRSDARIRGRRAFVVAGVCIVVPALACALLVVAPTPPASASSKAFRQTTRPHHADRVRGCNLGAVASSTRPACTWHVDDPRGRVVLLGDSNAGHFTEPLAAAANRAGYDFTVATFPSCPVNGLQMQSGGATAADAGGDLAGLQRKALRRCDLYAYAALADVLRTRPTVVVLSASTAIYLGTDGVQFRDPATGEVATSGAEKARMWQRGLGRVVRQLAEAGVATVVVHPVAQWKTWDSRDCAAVWVYFAPGRCGTTQTRRDAQRFRATAMRVERGALATDPRAVGVDPLPHVCHGATCATNFGNRWLYRDGRHLSVRGSMTLVDFFRQALSTAVARVNG